ncbi:MAG TPA: YfiR family protein [Verrucomicrobiae bacterium]|nr:YfiR family protein [Verrucomicrobiae bacterium]
MATAAVVILGSLIVTVRDDMAAAPALSEYQVKALFLFNFAKYVDWPSNAFGDGSAPIVIGLVGDDTFGDDVIRTVGGKSVNNRPVVFKHVAGEQEYRTCHILFVSASEKDHLSSILAAVKNTSVLTVGETDGFLTLNGMINFSKKDNKIRLEINLVPAQQANLKLSSKLLSVADVVLGKPEHQSASEQSPRQPEGKAD